MMHPDAMWPDPDKPGVPLNPEVGGWHWLRYTNCDDQVVWRWSEKGWWMNAADGSTGTISSHFEYIGPCLTPDQHAAALAASWCAGRDAASWCLRAKAQFCAVRVGGQKRADLYETLAHEFDALTPPSASALAAVERAGKGGADG